MLGRRLRAAGRRLGRAAGGRWARQGRRRLPGYRERRAQKLAALADFFRRPAVEAERVDAAAVPQRAAGAVAHRDRLVDLFVVPGVDGRVVAIRPRAVSVSGGNAAAEGLRARVPRAAADPARGTIRLRFVHQAAHLHLLELPVGQVGQEAARDGPDPAALPAPSPDGPVVQARQAPRHAVQDPGRGHLRVVPRGAPEAPGEHVPLRGADAPERRAVPDPGHGRAAAAGRPSAPPPGVFPDHLRGGMVAQHLPRDPGVRVHEALGKGPGQQVVLARLVGRPPRRARRAGHPRQQDRQVHPRGGADAAHGPAAVRCGRRGVGLSGRRGRAGREPDGHHGAATGRRRGGEGGEQGRGAAGCGIEQGGDGADRRGLGGRQGGAADRGHREIARRVSQSGVQECEPDRVDPPG